MVLQNIMNTLYNLRNMSKVQNNITKFITRMTKMKTLFYLNKNIKKLIIKHSNNIKAKTIHMRMKDSLRLYSIKLVILIGIQVHKVSQCSILSSLLLYKHMGLTSTIADARHQEENTMLQKMSEGHSSRESQNMYK